MEHTTFSVKIMRNQLDKVQQLGCYPDMNFFSNFCLLVSRPGFIHILSSTQISLKLLEMIGIQFLSFSIPPWLGFNNIKIVYKWITNMSMGIIKGKQLNQFKNTLREF